jgi:hypothetical protein
MFALYLVLMLLIFEIIALIIYLLPVPRFLLRMMSSLTSQLRLPIRIILAFLGYFVFGMLQYPASLTMKRKVLTHRSY